MDIEAVVEMLKNNRALWVAATITGGFAVIVSIINAIWLYFQRKKQLNYDKQLEEYKRTLEKKNYVSKVRFDAEFEIYRDLSKNLWLLVSAVRELFPHLDSLPVKEGHRYAPDEEKIKEIYLKRYEKSAETHNIALESIAANAPFVAETIVSKYEEILKMCRIHISHFKWWQLSKYSMGEHEYNERVMSWNKIDEYNNRFNAGDEIYAKMRELTEIIRENLDKLEVIN